MSNEEKLKELVSECKDLLFKIGLHVPVEYTYYVKKNVKHCLGCCYRKEKKISISSYLFSFEDKYIKEVIIHEMLHAIAPPKCKHNGQWKSMAEYVQRKYPEYKITTCKSLTEFGKSREEIDKIFDYKYKVVCLQCGNSNSQSRITKMKREGLAKRII